ASVARKGAVLITSRHPLPGADDLLASVQLGALSPAEVRRLLLRLPGLGQLSAADRGLLTATIGGHPRLIELTDALLRAGRASLPEVRDKLRDLARRRGGDAQGSADFLLAELRELLSPEQSAILAQVAASRAPMTLEDLSFALDEETTATPADI